MEDNFRSDLTFNGGYFPVFAGYSKPASRVAPSYIDTISSMACVYDHIYIGNAFASINAKLLIENKIGLVVNCSNDKYYENSLGIPVIYIQNFVDDDMDHCDLSAKVKIASDAIGIYEGKGESESPNVLVHCQAGINRSATVIAYHLIKRHDFAPYDAIELVKSVNINCRNTVAFTNPTFKEFIESLTILQGWNDISHT